MPLRLRKSMMRLREQVMRLREQVMRLRKQVMRLHKLMLRLRRTESRPCLPKEPWHPQQKPTQRWRASHKP
jgi:hypothetical protein